MNTIASATTYASLSFSISISPGVKSIIVFFEGLVVDFLGGEGGVLGSSDGLGGDGDLVADLEVGAAFCDDVGGENEDQGGDEGAEEEDWVVHFW